jgi:hypothetical protein
VRTDDTIFEFKRHRYEAFQTNTVFASAQLGSLNRYRLAFSCRVFFGRKPPHGDLETLILSSTMRLAKAFSTESPCVRPYSSPPASLHERRRGNFHSRISLRITCLNIQKYPLQSFRGVILVPRWYAAVHVNLGALLSKFRNPVARSDPTFALSYRKLMHLMTWSQKREKK